MLILGLFFRMCLPIFYLIFLPIFILLNFLGKRMLGFLKINLRILGLFFKFTC